MSRGGRRFAAFGLAVLLMILLAGFAPAEDEYGARNPETEETAESPEMDPEEEPEIGETNSEENAENRETEESEDELEIWETEGAEDLTAETVIRSNGSTKDYPLMTDGNVGTYLPLREKKAEMTITAPKPMGGIYVMIFDKYGRDYGYDLQIRDGEDWKTVDQGGTYLVHYHRLPQGVTEARIVPTSKERLRIAELRVFGPGDPPEEVQRWEPLEKCDLMLLTAHPDDEILWFAGLMPTYAGERGYRLQLVVMAPTGGQRRLELLQAVWHCGVKYYPEMLGFLDKNGQNPETQYSVWRGKDRVVSKVVEMIRKHQPEVLVTHGEKGEYGHGAHKTAADAAKNAVKVSGSSKKYAKSADRYGTWEVKKLYLHEYDKNQIVCDWNQPLEAFGGKTGYQVAEEAFQFHASQINRDWAFEVHGTHDNALFGLYYTAVGKDTGAGDLMEHIGTR